MELKVRKLLHVGGDNKRLMRFWPKLRRGDKGPEHLQNTVAIMYGLNTILEQQNWEAAAFYYPKTHQMMREVDAVGRLRAYRTEGEQQLLFPADLWDAVCEDSKVWMRMRRQGRAEPDFS